MCDAFIVLCGGVLTGILSACELLEQLSHHRVLPKVFLRLTPRTHAPYVSVFTFTAFCALIYATAGANLVVISEMFSIVWLSVMALFPLSLLLLRFNRGRLKRDIAAPLPVVLFALFVISPAILAGNIAIDPKTAGYFAVYVAGVLGVLVITQNKVGVLRHMYWVCDQWHGLGVRGGAGGADSPDGSPVSPARARRTGGGLVKLMTRMRRQVVCVCVKGDEVRFFDILTTVCKGES